MPTPAGRAFGFIRMSSGPGALKEKPRPGVSSCIDDTPRSASTQSAPARPSAASTCRQAREVRSPRDEDVRAEAQAPQPGLGLRQLERIDVEAEQPSARLEALEHRARVAAVAERAVHGDLAGLRVEHLQDLGQP